MEAGQQPLLLLMQIFIRQPVKNLLQGRFHLPGAPLLEKALGIFIDGQWLSKNFPIYILESSFILHAAFVGKIPLGNRQLAVDFQKLAVDLLLQLPRLPADKLLHAQRGSTKLLCQVKAQAFHELPQGLLQLAAGVVLAL